ncbi:MAG: sigma-54-dependent Fis family transcriptional regulator [Sandaracinus sp.]|nr:sigma-54-dependent Fis family transcriptional regulator [Sandaracinus sp.]MCB9636218.1 sigma-54-dependent Fis family transcriptional regulator [Sandaracinus sp.]
MSRILIVDDEIDTRELLALTLAKAGHETVEAGALAPATRLVKELEPLDLVIADYRLGTDDGLDLCRHVAEARPDVPVIVMTGYGSVEAAVGALRAGAYDFLTKPLDPEALLAGVRRALQHRSLTVEVRRLRQEVGGMDLDDDYGIVGRSPAMRHVFEMIDRIGASDATVLVTGESGTGKELVARAIHRRSARTGRCVAVNCAAMPANLLESELFGHVRGAFTDAKTDRDGLFLEANGGTLFLDEIGELELEMQPKLLRALQERVVRQVGSSRERRFDTRLVAATNRDLEREVERGTFREDLFYRVNVVNIALPPLRKRGHDVLLLAQSFLQRASERSGREVGDIDDAAAERLLEYDWPGNVRELQNCIERAVALARFDRITVDDLPEKVRRARSSRLALDARTPSEMPTLATLERRYVHKVLEATDGNKTAAAKVLGIDRRTLYRMLDRWTEEGAAAPN